VKIDQGFKTVILSDRQVGPDNVAVSALVALGAVHHHLVKNKSRSKIALVVETVRLE
jgi:glutamate synthase (NADPH/NADH)